MGGVRLGLVGAGTIGGIHAQAAGQAGLQLSCVADTNEQAARSLAQAHGVPEVVADPLAVFDSPYIDAVIIGVPNHEHARLAIAALEAGKDVLLEKPMGLNAGQCQRINDAAERAGRLVQVGFHHRYSTVGVAAKRFIEAGRMGTIYHAKASHYRRRGIPGLGGWFTTKAMAGGGALIDLGVHIIDLVIYLMGSPKPVRVNGKVYANFGPRMKNYLYEDMWAGPPKLDGVFDVEDAAHAWVRFEGGATLEVNTTWACNFPEGSMRDRIALFGDKAGMCFQLEGESLRIATEDQGYNTDLLPTLPPLDPFPDQLKAFVNSVQTRTAPHADGRAGQLVQTVIDAVYESSRLDREVAL